jgi:hypothetical protein
MLHVERSEVFNFEGAIRGMRNPLNSWDMSDSKWEDGRYVVGEKDYNLMTRLCKAGSDHRKFMRQIMVSLDITAPFYWWKEFDTYKVGTVANSCSTMHKLTYKKFELSDFSHEKLKSRMGESFESLDCLIMLIDFLNERRDEYLKTNAKSVWDEIIQLLPTSYNQKRTVTLNYEVLRNIYHARENHKLAEWHVLCDWIKTLPYSDLITMNFKGE